MAVTPMAKTAVAACASVDHRIRIGHGKLERWIKSDAPMAVTCHFGKDNDDDTAVLVHNYAPVCELKTPKTSSIVGP